MTCLPPANELTCSYLAPSGHTVLNPKGRLALRLLSSLSVGRWLSEPWLGVFRFLLYFP